MRALTIGTFDGLHAGHMAILTRLKELGEPTVVTFAQHPSSLFSKTPIPSITTLSHKIHLLELAGIRNMIVHPFTKEFSQQTAQEFLKTLKEEVDFSHLVLGYDAKLGYRQEGTRECIEALGKELGFTVEYIEPVEINNEVVSSSRIRASIQSQDLAGVEKFLLRPYSIFSTVEHGQKNGAKIGYCTANLDVSGLCLPTPGVWAVRVRHQNKLYAAVANLGIAPTFYKKRPCLLEVHLIDQECSLYGESIEVIFLEYLRPERCFETPDALKGQIAQDIQHAKTITMRA